jgi:NADH dehydrogenase
MSETHVVTGAFGYTGKYITRLLLEAGDDVRTLTGHPDRPSPFSRPVSVSPFNFDNPAALARTLEGADTLFNTYWIRFQRGRVTHGLAVRNIRALLRAAAEAGVRRVVHISITNATLDSPLPYFRGKAEAEELIKDSPMSHVILRPTLIFGTEDILINNLAWLLRKFPLHPIFGTGSYQVQPIFVEDLAEIAVRLAARDDDVALDAVGSEVFTYKAMLVLIAAAVGSRARFVRVSPRLAILGSRLLGLLVRDVVLSRDELKGLMDGLLVSRSDGPAPGTTKLSDWLVSHASELGKGYSSELTRHYR